MEGAERDSEVIQLLYHLSLEKNADSDIRFIMFPVIQNFIIDYVKYCLFQPDLVPSLCL